MRLIRYSIKPVLFQHNPAPHFICALGSVSADFVLDGLHIRSYFAGMIHSNHVTFGKPHPEVYLKAAASIQLNPVKCLVFEDSLSGIDAGLTAGCAVIGLTTTHSREEMTHAHLVIDDFEQMDLKTCLRLVEHHSV